MINEYVNLFRNSCNEGVFGDISCVRTFYDYSLQNVVRDVNGQEITKRMDREEIKPNKPFIYPKQYEKNTQDNIKKYLNEKRGISIDTINNLIQADLITEDKKNNCVFKWKDRQRNTIMSADRQGTANMNDDRSFNKTVNGS